MSHYQERLEQDLKVLRTEVRAVGALVEGAVRDAVRALLRADHALAHQIALGDLAVNRRIRRLDGRCHAFVARHLPSAGHLRFVSSVLRLDVALERIGDYAVTIAREVAQLKAAPPSAVASDVELLADQAVRLLGQALRAFDEGNAELAQGTKDMAGQIKVTSRKVFQDLLEEGEKGSHGLRDLFALLVVFHRLERVSDQAKNICEETVFAVTGQTKAPKIYRILFVDDKDNCQTQMAVAYARRAFPASGAYGSAGVHPAAEIEARCALFLDRHGYEGEEPRTLDASVEALARYHVVVSLGPDVEARLEETPFRTIFLRWDVGPAPDGLDQERAEELLAESQIKIRHHVAELMEALRGEGAD
jgi:phosphate transport system protein